MKATLFLCSAAFWKQGLSCPARFQWCRSTKASGKTTGYYFAWHQYARNRRVRSLQAYPRSHILPNPFLTARIEDTDKVKGFTVGGDDYIVKPFSLVELEARVRAHLRREARHNFEAQVKFSGDLTIDYSERCLFFGDKRIGLAKRNLILWNCFLKVQDRSLIKNGFMSVFGVMTARATAALWQSISAEYDPNSRHIPTAYILKRFGGVDTNGSSKLPQALFISPKKPCSLCNCLCCTRSLSIRNDFSICGSAAEGIRASYPPSGENIIWRMSRGNSWVTALTSE